MTENRTLTRRAVLATGSAALLLPTLPAAGRSVAPLARPIPSTGETLPAVGLGSWITFNVGDDPVLRSESAAVMDAFFAAGGRMIDSSPMYGSAQDVIGFGLGKTGGTDQVFSADKVWTGDGEDGPSQIERSRQLWRVPRFDLLQVHNLVAWEAHLATLEAMKDAGAVRYVGITTSHGRRHRDFERIMATRPLDFVQLTYNPVDREVEDRLLPLARERGISVIVNRPFRRGGLTQRLAREPLPDWAVDIGAGTWAQVILKFILAHPAVTVAIPATTQPAHAVENLAAANDPLPDADLRRRIVAAINAL